MTRSIPGVAVPLAHRAARLVPHEAKKLASLVDSTHLSNTNKQTLGGRGWTRTIDLVIISDAL